MDLQVKKIEIRHFCYTHKNSDTGLYPHPQSRDKLLIKGED